MRNLHEGNPSDLRHLIGTVINENAYIGVLMVMNEPSKSMRDAAREAGHVLSSSGQECRTNRSPFRRTCEASPIVVKIPPQTRRERSPDDARFRRRHALKLARPIRLRQRWPRGLLWVTAGRFDVVA
jgi:hypothetical protein